MGRVGRDGRNLIGWIVSMAGVLHPSESSSGFGPFIDEWDAKCCVAALEKHTPFAWQVNEFTQDWPQDGSEVPEERYVPTLRDRKTGKSWEMGPEDAQGPIAMRAFASACQETEVADAWRAQAIRWEKGMKP